jgi:hypothetical protein
VGGDGDSDYDFLFFVVRAVFAVGYCGGMDVHGSGIVAVVGVTVGVGIIGACERGGGVITRISVAIGGMSPEYMLRERHVVVVICVRTGVGVFSTCLLLKQAL